MEKRSRTILISSIGFFLLTVGAFSSVIFSPAQLQRNKPIPIGEQGIGSGGGKKAPSNLEPVAISKINKRTGVPLEGLSVHTSAVANFPLTGKVAYEFTVVDSHTGQFHDITLDKDGNELDHQQLVNDEMAAHKAKYGKLEPALAEKLEAAGVNEKIPVQIVLVEPDDDKDAPKLSPITGDQLRRMTEKEKQELEDKEDAIMQKRREHFANRSKQLLAPVLARLTELGYDCRTDQGSPTIYTEMEPKMIKEVETWPEVDHISLRGTSRSSLDVSRVAVGADVLEARGVPTLRIPTVAVVEVGGHLNAAPPHPYLPNYVQDYTNLCASTSDHGTAVAGIIQSSHSLVRGMDTNAAIWYGGSCGGDDASMQSAIQAAVAYGVQVVNCSFGHFNDDTVVHAFDQFMDRIVKVNRVTIVVASGNTGILCSGNGNVIPPGKAYNVITVGAFDDQNSPALGDDVIWNCQCDLGPSSLYGDRNKPEVLAPGVRIRSLLTSPPWTEQTFSGGWTGTSVAAPHVTGEIALMTTRTKALKFRPEANKAILLAGTTHEIFINGSYPVEREGAGLITAASADDILTGLNGNWGEVVYDCTSPNPFFVTAMPNLNANSRTRVAIAWDQSNNYFNYFNQPSADLNLVVRDPNGLIVSGFGNSHDETHEWIEFYPSIPGTYTINIESRYCDNVPNGIVGWAWWQFH